MSSKKFNYTKRKFSNRNFSDVIEVLIPDLYLESDIDVSGQVVDPTVDIISSHINLANDFSTILPLSSGAIFSALNSYAGISQFFIKQNNFSEITPEEFERNILNLVDTSFKNFNTSGEFKSYVDSTLIPKIQTNEAKDLFSGASGIDYLCSQLGWFYLLAASSTHTYQPSSTVSDYFTSYLYRGKSLSIVEGINALTEFVWKNQATLETYIPDNFLSGSTTYTSGTQSLDNLKTLNSVIYSNNLLSRDDTKVLDAFELFDQTGDYLEDRVSNGPFWRLVKAFSYAFADMQNETNSLEVLYDLEDCPDYLLPELAKLIGWELLGYDADKWRLQLANAVSIYKKAGTKESILAAVNSVFSPGVVNLSGNIEELWESYIPFLIEYSLATESIHFKDFSTWTFEKAEQLNVEGYDYSNFNNNIKLAVDTILLTLFQEFPDIFILAGSRFPRNSPNFQFNYRGRDFPIPPYEEIPYYLDCSLTGDFLLRLIDLLVCFGVPSTFAIQVKDYIDSFTKTADDEAYAYFSDDNGWLFFTKDYQRPPNWDAIIIDPTNKNETYLSLWNGKSSHYTLNFEGNSFDFSKNTLEVDSKQAIIIASRMADIFSPAHAVKNASVFLAEEDNYSANDDAFPEVSILKYDYSEVDLSSTIFGNYESSGLALLKQFGSEFSGGRYSFSSLANTELSSVSALIAPRNAFRRRGFENKLNTGSFYSRTGFNPPIFLDGAITYEKYRPVYKTYNQAVPFSSYRNPVKGLYPHVNLDPAVKSFIPHSVEGLRLEMSALYVSGGLGTSTIDFTVLDDYLNEISALNCQTNLRIHIDYPTPLNEEGEPLLERRYGLPGFLREDLGGPVSATQYFIPAGQWDGVVGGYAVSGYVPDYNSPELIEECERLISALGAAYDGDPRLAVIQVGFAGHWGEWHNFGAFTKSVLPVDFTRNPPNTFVNDLLTAFTTHFTTTKITGRFVDWQQPQLGSAGVTLLSGTNYPVGLHDDSFGYSTLGLPRYYSFTQLKAYKIVSKYKTALMEGEIYPQLQQNLDVFFNTYKATYPQTPQNIFDCIRLMGATMLSCPDAFREAVVLASQNRLTSTQTENILKSITKLGYNFTIQESFFPERWYVNEDIPIIVGITNVGSAPFYYDWPVVLTLTDGVSSLDIQTSFDIKTIMPNMTSYIVHTVTSDQLTSVFPAGGNLSVYLSIQKPADFIQNITFLNEDHVANTPYMNLGNILVQDTLGFRDRQLPLGFIPSALEFASVSTDCSGLISSIPAVYDRCIVSTPSSIYGYDASATLKTRGPYALINNFTGQYRSYYQDRGQLDPYLAVIHKVADQSVRKKYEQYVEDNPTLFINDFSWKNVVASLTNEEIFCSGFYLSSLENYGNQGLGKKIPKLYDLYTSAFNRHPTSYARNKDFGANIYAHAFGNIIYNGDFERRGSIATSYGLYTTNISDTKLLNRSSIYFSGSEANLTSYQTYTTSALSSIIASSTTIPQTVELINSSIIAGADMIHTSGASLDNYFVLYDLQTVNSRSSLYNNALLRMKSVNGLPRIRFKIPGIDFSESYDEFRNNNFLCPEHNFNLTIRGLASLESGRTLVDSRLGVWIHTDTENSDQTWHYANDGKWKLINTNELTIPKILFDLTHEVKFRREDRSDRTFQCLNSDSLYLSNFLSGITTFREDEYQTFNIKFNTINKCHIRVPEEYYKHKEQVHRLDQTYVIEIFMIPGNGNTDKFILLDHIDLIDETIHDMTRIDVSGVPTGHKKYPLCKIKHVNLNREDIRSILNYYNQVAGKSFHEGILGRSSSESERTNYASGGSRLDFRINPEFLNNTKDPDTNHYTLLEVSVGAPSEQELITLGSQFSPPGDVSGIGTVPIDPEDLALLNYGFWFG